MYQVSDDYKRAILKHSRNFESKITIGNKILTNEQLISLNINNAIQQDDTFSIGNAIASTLNLTFLHNDILVSDTDIIDVQIGLLMENLYEYIPMGVYNIDKIEETDTLCNIVAYDNMIKFDVDYIENTEAPTVQSVIGRLEELTGIQFAGNLSDYTNYSLDILTGYSCRVILGFIAGLFGCNAIIDRRGKFKFVSIGKEVVNEVSTENLTSDNVTVRINNNYNSDVYFTYTKKNKNYTLTRITNTTDIEELTVGNDEGMCLFMNNPYLNQVVLTDLYEKLKNIEYAPFNMNWQGDLSLDLGDKIAVIDMKGVVREHPILAINFNYNGGLTSVLQAQGETSVTNTYKKPTTQQEQEIIATKKKVVKIEKDAGELYVVVYDSENNSSIRLTEKLLEAIAEEITLQAKNIKLEGYTTINDKFKVLEDGTMEAVDGKFTGTIEGTNIQGSNIKGSSYHLEGFQDESENLMYIVDIENGVIQAYTQQNEVVHGLFKVKDGEITLGMGDVLSKIRAGSFALIPNENALKNYMLRSYKNIVGEDEFEGIVAGIDLMVGRNLVVKGMIKGNADTANKLSAARTISLTGDVTGSTTFDGSANKSITTKLPSPSSENWFKGFTKVNTDGVMEVGKYIDFHNTNDTTDDYNTRLECNNSGNNTLKLPKESGTLALEGSGNIKSNYTVGNTSYYYIGKLLVCWGYLSITPSASNTPISLDITFPKAFSVSPCVMATPAGTNANTIQVRVGTLSTTGCKITLIRNSTTATNIQWFAIGSAKN